MKIIFSYTSRKGGKMTKNINKYIKTYMLDSKKVPYSIEQGSKEKHVSACDKTFGILNKNGENRMSSLLANKVYLSNKERELYG